eukprot:3235454-Alexandrium_andersonii.AAC.3
MCSSKPGGKVLGSPRGPRPPTARRLPARSVPGSTGTSSAPRARRARAPAGSQGVRGSASHSGGNCTPEDLRRAAPPRGLRESSSAREAPARGSPARILPNPHPTLLMEARTESQSPRRRLAHSIRDRKRCRKHADAGAALPGSRWAHTTETR